MSDDEYEDEDFEYAASDVSDAASDAAEEAPAAAVADDSDAEVEVDAKMKKKVKTTRSPWRPQSRRRERALMASSKRVIAQFEPSSFRHMSALRITDCTSQRPPTLSQCGPNRSRQVQCRSRTPLETLRVNLTSKHIKSCISEGVR